MKKQTIIALTMLAAISFTACGDAEQSKPTMTDPFMSESSNGDDNEQETSIEHAKPANEGKIHYSIGETWEIEGQWKLTVTGVSEVSDRNPYTDKTPAAVYLVEFNYENLGYVDKSGFMSGLYFVMDDKVVDGEGKMGYSYPGDISKAAVETPVGASCDGQACIGVDNAGSFQIMVEKYDGNEDLQKAIFNVIVD